MYYYTCRALPGTGLPKHVCRRGIGAFYSFYLYYAGTVCTSSIILVFSYYPVLPLLQLCNRHPATRLSTSTLISQNVRALGERSDPRALPQNDPCLHVYHFAGDT